MVKSITIDTHVLYNALFEYQNILISRSSNVEDIDKEAYNRIIAESYCVDYAIDTINTSYRTCTYYSTDKMYNLIIRMQLDLPVRRWR